MINKSLGILGGGQLGRMLVEKANAWNLKCLILDKNENYPAGNVGAEFVVGDFDNFQDVLDFGRKVDVLTVEIEHVNLDALRQLQKEGKKIHPNPEALHIIKDKGLQKEFYTNNGFPTSPFTLFPDSDLIVEAVNKGKITLPFVQKSRLSGYDGRGVFIVKSVFDLDNLLKGPSLVEEMVQIDTEISVIAARNEAGEIICYPAVDMEFHPIANLVEYVSYPSIVPQSIQEKATQLAGELIAKLQISGLLAVEFFVDKSGGLIINEIAPRPHNSGHLSMNAAKTSQFEQHLRGVLNLPLGQAQFMSPGVMVNLLGQVGYSGNVKIEGTLSAFQEKGTYLHWYGKDTTKPYRKMGHANVLHSDVRKAMKIAKKISSLFQIIS